MHYQFSPQSNIARSATLVINSQAAALRAAGNIVHNLSVGEALIPTDPVIIAGAKAALDADYTKYTPVAGIASLRQAWRDWMEVSYGGVFDVGETTVTAGGKQALLLLLQILIKAGDEVIIPAPYWVSYPALVQLSGGTARILETTEVDGWKLLPDLFRTAITDRTRILILNSAGNPTGAVYTKDELSALLAIAAAHNIIVISDEVYSSLVYQGEYISCAAFPAYRDSVCIVQSVSKHFGMTGWRVGAVFAPAAITARVQTLESQSTSGAASISQYAALAALSDADRLTTQMRTALQARRDYMVDTCASYGIALSPAPSGLYQFVPLTSFGSSTTDSVAWCSDILARAHVAMVPGIAFGKEGYVRLSFGGEEASIRVAIDALMKNAT